MKKMVKKVIQNRALYGELAPLYDFVIGEKNTKKETSFLHKIFKKHGKNIKTILDVGCGTGRHADALVRHGYRAIGIDVSEKMLEAARQKIPHAKFLRMDMRRIRLKKPVDAAISMWTTACYLFVQNTPQLCCGDEWQQTNNPHLFAPNQSQKFLSKLSSIRPLPVRTLLRRKRLG